MTLVREPGSEVIAQFVVPYKGTWKNVPAHKVPVDAVHDSYNVYIREGQLRTRPGLSSFTDGSAYADDTNIVIGGLSFVNHDSVYIYLVTKDKLYMKSTYSAWEVTQPIGPEVPSVAASDHAVVDTAALQVSGNIAVVFASEGIQLRVKSTPGLAFGMPYITSNIVAKSVCIASSRVIALVPPHTITWSSVLDFNTFDPTALAIRSQTLDLGICVKQLSSLSFVLYKDQSIHTARAQAGVDESTAFAFSEPIVVEGPAGIHAVVDVNGTHMYMTRSGRIAVFDGTNYPTWIADGVWFFLQEDINTALAYKIRGVFDQRLNIVTFYYPKSGGTSYLQGMVTLCLPLQIDIEAVTNPSVFLGECKEQITHTIYRRDTQTLNRAVVIGKPDEDISGEFKLLLLDETATSDNGQIFSSHFQTGLQSAPDALHMQPCVESFIERGRGYGTVKIEPILSDILETFSGTKPDARAHRLNLEFNPVNEYIGFQKKSRFFGLKYTWTSDDTVRYNGAVVYSKTPQRRQ